HLSSDPLANDKHPTLRAIETDIIRVQRSWSLYFADVPLVESRWFEGCDPALFAKALAIASEEDKHGRFSVRSQDHIGKYVSGIIRKLKAQADAKSRTLKSIIELKVAVHAGYEISEADKARFRSKLVPSGDC